VAVLTQGLDLHVGEEPLDAHVQIVQEEQKRAECPNLVLGFSSLLQVRFEVGAFARSI